MLNSKYFGRPTVAELSKASVLRSWMRKVVGSSPARTYTGLRFSFVSKDWMEGPNGRIKWSAICSSSNKGVVRINILRMAPSTIICCKHIYWWDDKIKALARWSWKEGSRYGGPTFYLKKKSKYFVWRYKKYTVGIWIPYIKKRKHKKLNIFWNLVLEWFLTKYPRSGVPTRGSLSRRIPKLCNLSQVKAW